eukprot:gb/GECH01010145.1/.p1 GENE.gb/GECH01010145.1/~~gb/GECH01010145.1/.p1  ORF type:complete len:180 (+),score=8.66 gb/GECH01010145.1/:1-540(+)
MDPKLDIASMSENVKEKFNGIMAVASFEALNVTGTRRSAAFIPFNSKKSNVDFITIRGDDYSHYYPLSDYYGFHIDEKCIVKHTRFLDAFAMYIATHDLLNCTTENQHIYDWFNKVILFSNYDVSKPMPRQLYDLNRRIYSKLPSNPQLCDDGTINIDVLRNKKLENRISPRKRQRTNY